MATEESTPHQDTDESSERRVLLVDDEPAVRDVLAAALRIFGFETHIVSTFEQALNRAREFDLERRNFSLVTALQMPIVSTMSPRAGFELVANLHQSGIRPLTVLVAEQLNPQAQEEAKKLGIEVAIKPVFSKLDSSAYLKDLRAFVVTVRQLLSGEDTEIDQSMDANEDRLLPYFLSSITEQIADPNQSVDASRMVLPVAASIDLHERKRTSGSHDLDPSSDSGTGLRRAPRISGLTIEADIRTADRTIRVEVTDLAEGGAFLVTDQRFAVGEMLRVRVFLPGQLGRIEMEAKVAWIKECSSGQQPGVGIEFVGILPNSHSVGLVAAGELPSQ